MAFNIMDAIKNREQIAPPEVKSDGRIKIEYISIKNIIPARDSRNYYSTEDIETLKADIALRGVKQNLLVKAVEDGKYELIAGERRWRASSALFNEGKTDYEFVPCAVECPIDDLDQRLLLTTTNSTARELTDYEKGLQVKEMGEILDEYERRGAIIEGPRRELIQKHLGLSSGQIGRYTAIHNNLSEALLKEYVKKEIGVSIAYELSKLPEGKQGEAYRLYLEQGGLSIKDIKQFQEIKENLQALERQGQTRIDEFAKGGALSESDTNNPEKWIDEDEDEEEAATPGSMINEHGIYKSQFIETTVISIPKYIGNITLEMVYDSDDGLYHPGIDYWINKRKSGGGYSPRKERGFASEEEAVKEAFSNLIKDEEVRKALIRAGYAKEEDCPEQVEAPTETPTTEKVDDFYDQYGRMKADKDSPYQQYRNFDKTIDIEDERLPEGGFRLYLVQDKEDSLWRSSAARGFIEAGGLRWPHRDTNNPKDSKIYPAFETMEEALRYAAGKMFWHCNQEQKVILKSMGYIEPEAETPAPNIVNEQGIYLDEYITETKLDIPSNYSEITIEIAHDPRDDKYRASYSFKSKNNSGTYKPSESFKPYDTEKQAFDAMIDRIHLIGSADAKEALLAGGYTNTRQMSPAVELKSETAPPEEPKKAWEEMTPCEQCRSANPWCEELHCCKTCKDTCNGQQICRIDDPPEKRQQEIDEWNRQAREARDENNEIHQTAKKEERCYIERRLEFLRNLKNIAEKEGKGEKYLKLVEQRAKIIENVLSFLN